MTSPTTAGPRIAEHFVGRRAAVDVRDGVGWITLESPPVNLVDFSLLQDLGQAVGQCAVDDAVRVVVLQSADPDFFLAHFAIEDLLSGPAVQGPAQRGEQLNDFHQLCEALQNLPEPTIAKIAGRVGGAGSEIALACDMRFGAVETTLVNQLEVGLGLIPGAGGTVRLPRLLGRGRALELILSSTDLDAVTAERWGYLNRAVPADQLDGLVDGLARRIATHPAAATAAAKAAVDDGADRTDQLLDEWLAFSRLLRAPEGIARMRRFLELGGETREAERHLDDLLRQVSAAGPAEPHQAAAGAGAGA